MKRFVAGLLVGLAFAGLMSLGFWQVKRLAWKEGLMADIARYQSESVNLAQYIDDPSAEFRHGTLTGVWDEVSVLPTKNVTMRANFGHWIATSLDLGEGKSIVVNRGWVPEGSQETVVAAALPRGPVTISGTLRRGGILEAYKREGQAHWVLFADQADHPALEPAPVAVSLRNDHKQYAIFWFTMAALVLIMGLFSLLKARSASSPNP